MRGYSIETSELSDRRRQFDVGACVFRQCVPGSNHAVEERCVYERGIWLFEHDVAGGGADAADAFVCGMGRFPRYVPPRIVSGI